MTTEVPARLHIIAAKEAPIAVIIRRKPSKVFHIIVWNLLDDSMIHGSWFQGKLFPLSSEVSWDGKYLAYNASGQGTNWTGICQPPFLKTVVEWNRYGSDSGIVHWRDSDHLPVHQRR